MGERRGKGGREDGREGEVKGGEGGLGRREGMKVNNLISRCRCLANQYQ